MTSPLHGEGPGFKSPWAHFCIQTSLLKHAEETKESNQLESKIITSQRFEKLFQSFTKGFIQHFGIAI